jgi:DNA-binding transcriptional regulator YhcF (GntR family)
MPLILVHVLLPLKTVLKLYKNLKKSKMMEKKKKKKKEMLSLKKKKLEKKKKKKKKKEMNHHLMKTLKISKKVFSNLNLPHN